MMMVFWCWLWCRSSFAVGSNDRRNDDLCSALPVLLLDAACGIQASEYEMIYCFNEAGLGKSFSCMNPHQEASLRSSTVVWFVLPCDNGFNSNCHLLICFLSKFRHNATLRDLHHDIPLSMVDDSIDDMYFGCLPEMLDRVKKEVFDREKQESEYAVFWNKAEDCARQRLTNGLADGLTMQHLQAICVYTAYGLYSDFNIAVRTQRSQYGSSFHFHALHSLLTSSIQILQKHNYCHKTYRRTKNKFTGKVGQIIRFGTFTSSSHKTNLKLFGSKTCFEIKTCLGAFLKNYSFFEREKEVLIPPYEMFNITKVYSGGSKHEALKDCSVVFVLESAGGKSNLNCKLFY